MPIDGQVRNQVRWIFDSLGRIVGYKNPDSDQDQNHLNAAEVAAIQALVSGGGPIWNAAEPTRGSVIATSIQFRGAADTASSIGTIGLTVNAASDTAAGNRLAALDADWTSQINGAATTGRAYFIGPFDAAVTRVHIAQLGLTPPLTDNPTGPVLAASNQMTELTFDAGLAVRALLITEGGPTNFAGAAGNGSARYVTIYGLSEAVT